MTSEIEEYTKAALANLQEGREQRAAAAREAAARETRRDEENAAHDKTMRWLTRGLVAITVLYTVASGALYLAQREANAIQRDSLQFQRDPARLRPPGPPSPRPR